MFKNIKNGCGLLQSSIAVIIKKPVFLLPLFFSWTIYALVILYVKYFFKPNSMIMVWVVIYLAVLIFSLSICFSNLIMLELVQQIESGKKTSCRKAIAEAASSGMPRAFPIAIIWSILWFIIVVIRVLSRDKTTSDSGKLSIKNAAKTLGGANGGPLTWLEAGLSIFEKMLRMSVFLALPAIAWQRQSAKWAMNKAEQIIKKHPVEFLTAYTLTDVVAILMAIPLIVIFHLDDRGVEFSKLFWLGVIFYEGFVWSVGMYLEQMTTGLLYLWHLKWKRTKYRGKLSTIPKPDLLDDIYELKTFV